MQKIQLVSHHLLILINNKKANQEEGMVYLLEFSSNASIFYSNIYDALPSLVYIIM